MNELRLLQIASKQAGVRRLLESALEDHSPPGAADRALQALNLGAFAAASVVTAQAAASSSVGSHVAGAVVLKWLGLGVVAGTVALVSAERVRLAISESPPAPASPLLQTEKPVVGSTDRVASSAPPPNVPEGTPGAKKPHPAGALELRAADSAVPTLETSEPAADPLQQLRTIRRALADHSPARALSLLDVFVTRYPSSSLLEEAAVLRFDALSRLHRGDARAEGQRFLLRYPRSAYAERVRIELSGLQ